MFSRYFQNFNEVKWVDDNLINEPFDDEDIAHSCFSHLYFSYKDIVLLPDVTEIPIELEFKNKGNFSCAGTQLKSLKNCPQKVSAFICNDCTELESLEHCPFEVDYFDCSGCLKLKSLRHLPLNFANSESIIPKILETLTCDEIQSELIIFKELFNSGYLKESKNTEHFKKEYYDNPHIELKDYKNKYVAKCKTNKYGI